MTDTEKRFWPHVNKNGPDYQNLGKCWLWDGYRTKAGYGMFRVKGVMTYVHRYFWIKCGKPDPTGLMVCHHCDTPNCVAPRHLFLGDGRANAVDMVNKGRHFTVTRPERVARGERTHTAKLTDELVRLIRRNVANGARQVDQAKLFNVRKLTIGKVVRRETWRHVV